VVAPEPYLSACLAVVERAISCARSAPAETEQVVAVMEAVHNIPYFVQHWEHCDEARLRSFLEHCDARFPTGLLAAYTFILERRRQ